MSPSFFKKLGPINLNTIKSVINCTTINLHEDECFSDFVSIDNLSENSLSFLYDSEYSKIEFPKSITLLCTKKKSREFDSKQKLIIVSNVQETVAILSNIFYRDYTLDELENLKSPLIGENCEIGKNVIIENGVTIGNNVRIDHGAVIKNNCVIGDGAFIGSNCVISNSILGNQVYIGSNSSLGQRGFGFYLNVDKNRNIYHIGRVVLKENVSIGSGCTIDRGSFSDTTIGKNTYFDNLCHIAHNVQIGSNSTFAAMAGIAGSAKIGNNVLTGGQVGIAGHIKIGNNVQVAAKSGVLNDLKDGEVVMGFPAIKKYKFIKSFKKTYGKK